jgi:hypothetical protein
MKNKIIVPAGYNGSGSSAVTDLVSELEGFQSINDSAYEYIFMHCPNGLFDLEDKLLVGNNSLRSDEAIHSFLKCMHKLHYERNYWYSDYAVRVSPQFYTFCQELIADLHPVTMTDVYWYHQDNIDTLKNRLLWHARLLASKLLRRHIPKDRPYKPQDYTDMQLVYPQPEEFYAAAKAMLNKLFRALGLEEHHLVLDQLLLPHNLHRLDHYFDDNVRVFVVARDPRDVFLLNKYVWLPDHVAVPFPTTPEEFCVVYDAMRRSEKPAKDSRILRLNFEDLVYRYDDTCRRLYPFLDVGAQQHTASQGTKFKPEVSIRNTQLFRQNLFPTEEIPILEKNLGPYLYDFPTDVPLPSITGTIF